MASPLITVKLENWDSTRARLALFPDNMRRNFMRGGARAAASLLAKRLKARLNADGMQTAAGSVRSSVKLIDRGIGVRGTVQYGGKYGKASGRGANRKKEQKDAWYAHILEWGAKAHEIKPGKGRRALAVGPPVSDFKGAVKHPGIRARLYAAKTAQQDMPAAQRAFADYVDKRVTRFWSTGR